MSSKFDKYLPQEFEKKWVKKWEEEKTYKTKSPTTSHPARHRKPRTCSGVAGGQPPATKIYCLSMFPYPSGAGLHVGHVRIYTGCDVLARYFRMKGFAVLHPMGWDAFGLPAENAAIKAEKNPLDMVLDNISTFKKQMMSLGLSYDWSREFSTTDPEYYKWTQWLFIQFFKAGLLYKKNAPINFCPKCKTGLSEEEVLSDGIHERCGSVIVKKDLPQWIFKITAYADKLLKDLEGLNWPPGILEMQRKWIGRKEGITILYKVLDPAIVDPVLEQPQKIPHSRFFGAPGSSPPTIAEISCFTTRPDTNFGATFIVVAPEHQFVVSLLSQKSRLRRSYGGQAKIQSQRLKEIKEYVENAGRKTEMERIAEGRKKTGVFTGFYAINNLNGRLMPIWISDFVLPQVGTGAVVGVPGHDLRDFEFAKEFNLEVVRVVVGKNGDKSPITCKEQVQEEEGIMINSDFLNGMDIHKATKKIMDYLEEKGWGKRVVTYHLRDWIFSRQRYWGEPIPMVYCRNCAEKKVNYWNTIKNPKSNSDVTSGQNSKQKSFENLSASWRIENSDLIRNSDLEIRNSLVGWFPVSEEELPIKLPYVKSYQPTATGESPLSKIDSFVKTKCPNCGAAAERETDTMPNWAGSCWYFIRFAQSQKSKVKSQNFFENWSASWRMKIENSPWLPVDWYLGGAEHAVLHLLYSRFWVKALYDLGLLDFNEPFLRLRNVGIVLAEDHRKMSKSFGNTINPDEVINEYGADSLRIYEMFMAPFSSEISWSAKALQGGYRFLNRIWQIYHNSDELTDEKIREDIELKVKLQKTINKVESDILNNKFNTAIAAMMEFLNEWESKSEALNPKSEKNPKSKIQNKNLKCKINKRKENSGQKKLSRENAKKFLQVLAPFAPFITEEIWREVFGEKSSVHLSKWPLADKSVLKDEEITIAIQVNGKTRGTILITSDEINNQQTVVKKAIEVEKVKKYIKETNYKLIYVKGKVLNFVI